MMVTPVMQFQIHARMPRYPEFGVPVVKRDRAVVDRQMVSRQFEFLHRLAQIRFYVQHLICRGCYPHAALQGNFYRLSLCFPQPQIRALVWLLPKVHEPRRFASTLSQSLARKIERTRESGVEYIYAQSQQSNGCK